MSLAEQLIDELLEVSDKHRCDNCGCRYEEHKGGTDKNGAKDICPPIKSFGNPVPMKMANIPDDKLDNYLNKYWNKSKSKWKPKT